MARCPCKPFTNSVTRAGERKMATRGTLGLPVGHAQGQTRQFKETKLHTLANQKQEFLRPRQPWVNMSGRPRDPMQANVNVPSNGAQYVQQLRSSDGYTQCRGQLPCTGAGHCIPCRFSLAAPWPRICTLGCWRWPCYGITQQLGWP